MNNTSPFIRKIFYIACIGGLLIPLSMVSRPETRDGDGAIQDPGGVLSSLRENHDLSQAKVSEIDPASETMKLASLGLRGVAVNMLWMQAMDHKKKENYDQLASTLQTLTKIQPSFVKVWEFQAHNLSYNVSMEFDDYEYRYVWVKKGLAFLKKGIPYNKRDHRVPSKLGFFTGNKFGKSDEKLSFRRIFRKDDEFHREMSDFINPDSYDQRSYGPDSWKMAYQWYDYSRKMVEEESCRQLTNDLLFYMYRPSQIRHQAISLQDEYRTEEIIQEIWRESQDQWIDYGNEKITNSLGVTFTLEGVADVEAKVEKLREKLDKLAPEGLRQSFLTELMAQKNVPEEDIMLMKLDPSERTEEQNQQVHSMVQDLSKLDRDLDNKIALEVPEGDRKEANRIAFEISSLLLEISTSARDSEIVNYSYWRERTEAEAKDLTAEARRSLYDAKQMWRQSIYDDEYDFDYKTKTKTITNRGAITLYLEAFEKWDEVFKAYPLLKDGLLANQITESIQEFQKMLDLTSREWPEDFPLQDFVDFRFASGEIYDKLPTTEDLEELRSGREDLSSEDDQSSEDQPSGDSSNDSDESDSETQKSSESMDDQENDQ